MGTAEGWRFDVLRIEIIKSAVEHTHDSCSQYFKQVQCLSDAKYPYRNCLLCESSRGRLGWVGGRGVLTLWRYLAISMRRHSSASKTGISG